MGSVRSSGAGAWVLLRAYFRGNSRLLLIAAHVVTVCGTCAAYQRAYIGVTVADLGYVVLTLAVFGVLLLILKGIERFER
jgi:hypothetical protein